MRGRKSQGTGAAHEGAVGTTGTDVADSAPSPGWPWAPPDRGRPLASRPLADSVTSGC